MSKLIPSLLLVIVPPILSTERPSEQPNWSASLSNRATGGQAQARFEEAADLLAEALAQASKGSVTAADTFTRLGSIHHELGRHLEAEREHREAARITRSHGPRGEAVLASALNNLGTLYAETGKLAAARQSLQESIGIRRRIAGPADAILVSPLRNLVTLEPKLGNPVEARQDRSREARKAHAPSGA